MSAELDRTRQRASDATVAWGKVYARLVAKQGGRRGPEARRLEHQEREMFAEVKRLRAQVAELEANES